MLEIIKNLASSVDGFKSQMTGLSQKVSQIEASVTKLGINITNVSNKTSTSNMNAGSSFMSETELKIFRDKMLNFERFMGNTILTN